MKTSIAVTRGVVGITGIIQLVLGVLFWLGFVRGLIPLHMILGLVFVLGLWTLAVLCARAGAPAGLVAFALAWGFVIPALGMTQMQILPGPGHWMVRTAHLLTAVVGMALVGPLVARASAASSGPWGRAMSQGTASRS